MDRSEFRRQVLDTVELLASPSEQLEYERTVPIAHVFGELVEFANDLMRPRDAAFVASFSDAEINDLCELRGLVTHAARNIRGGDMTSVLKSPEWRAVVHRAQELSAELAKSAP